MATEATVTVFFLEYTPPEGNVGPLHVFLFNPITVVTLTGDTGPSSYTVIFNLTSNIPGTVIDGLEPGTNQATPPDLQVNRSNNNMTITATFTNEGLTQEPTTNFGFRMSVRVPGREDPFTSEDPEVEVPPPNG